MRKPIIAGNWKMHFSIKEAINFVTQFKPNVSGVTHREIVLCPVFTVLNSVNEILKGTNIALGAQNLFWEEKGAFTGEIAPKMLIDAGCKYVIAGHSERRQYFGETDETVNKKMFAAFNAGLTPIVCIGETLQQREKNTTFDVIRNQVSVGIKGLNAQQADKLVIAYEPVWAIGTGKTATSAQAQEIHKFVRDLYKELYGPNAAGNVRILYGGSVKPENIAELMNQDDVDGGLVGGASMVVDSFTKIVKYK